MAFGHLAKGGVEFILWPFLTPSERGTLFSWSITPFDQACVDCLALLI